jgi:hypothetical protein
MKMIESRTADLGKMSRKYLFMSLFIMVNFTGTVFNKIALLLSWFQRFLCRRIINDVICTKERRT